MIISPWARFLKDFEADLREKNERNFLHGNNFCKRLQIPNGNRAVAAEMIDSCGQSAIVWASK
jgi:hypothetical protein